MTTLDIPLQDRRDRLQSVDVARAADGSFALTWSVLDYERVTVENPNGLAPPTITGDFVVSQAIYLQVYDTDGLAPGSPRLLTRTAVTPMAYALPLEYADPSPSVSFSDDGGLTVAWSPTAVNGSFVVPGKSIMVSSSGLESAADVNLEIQLQDSRDRLQSVDVARAANGRFALTWSVLDYERVTVGNPLFPSPGATPTITEDFVVSQAIYLQVYDADGLAPSSPRLLTRTAVTPMAYALPLEYADPSPSVSFSDDGRLTVAWSTTAVNGSFVVPGKSIMVSSSGLESAADVNLEIQLQDSRDRLQSVDVARAANGRFALTWSVLDYERVTVVNPLDSPSTITGDFVVS
jgi:hypothetical protein